MDPFVSFLVLLVEVANLLHANRNGKQFLEPNFSTTFKIFQVLQQNKDMKLWIQTENFYIGGYFTCRVYWWFFSHFSTLFGHFSETRVRAPLRAVLNSVHARTQSLSELKNIINKPGWNKTFSSWKCSESHGKVMEFLSRATTATRMRGVTFGLLFYLTANVKFKRLCQKRGKHACAHVFIIIT